VWNLQEYFNQNYQNDSKQVYLEGNKIGEIEGNTLIIENFKELQYFYLADLPKLTKLTIKNCKELKSLELHLDKKIEIVLLGNYSKLNNIKTINTQQQPVMLKSEGCNCGGVRLFFESILIILNILLLSYIFFDKRKKETKKF